MSDITVKAIDELGASFHGVVRLAGAELGISAFGLQVLELPAEFEHYPEHDHRDDGQEEVYVVLRGTVAVIVDGRRTDVGADEMVRIGPSCRRKLIPGPDGARVLAIGCAADRAYLRPTHFDLGAAV